MSSRMIRSNLSSLASAASRTRSRRAAWSLCTRSRGAGVEDAPTSTRAWPIAQSNGVLPAPELPMAMRLAPVSTQAPAARASMRARGRVGSALKSRVARVLPAGQVGLVQVALDTARVAFGQFDIRPGRPGSARRASLRCRRARRGSAQCRGSWASAARSAWRAAHGRRLSRAVMRGPPEGRRSWPVPVARRSHRPASAMPRGPSRDAEGPWASGKSPRSRLSAISDGEFGLASPRHGRARADRPCGGRRPAAAERR